MDEMLEIRRDYVVLNRQVAYVTFISKTNFFYFEKKNVIQFFPLLTVLCICYASLTQIVSGSDHVNTSIIENISAFVYKL